MACPMCGGRMVWCGWIKPFGYGRRVVYRCVRCGYRRIG